MASFEAILEIEGFRFRLLHCTYAVSQATDSRGRAASKVRHSAVQLVLDVPETDVLLTWATDPHKRLAAHIVFLSAATASTLETLSLKAAYCVGYQEQFVHGDGQEGAYQCTLTLADPEGFTIQAGGPATAQEQSVRQGVVAHRYASALAEVAPVALRESVLTSLAQAAPAAVSYSTTPMDPDYVGEETGAVWGTAVKYLSAEERKAYELTVQADGLLYNAQGQLFDTKGAGTVTGKGKAIFVMSATGEVYASLNHQAGLFHHSSFLAGGPVAAAGELEVLNGVITSVSNRSGHYTPEHTYTHQFVEQLWRQGVQNTAEINIEDFDH